MIMGCAIQDIKLYFKDIVISDANWISNVKDLNPRVGMCSH